MDTPETFVAGHVAEVEPLLREAALEEWEAAATGDPVHDEKGAELRARIMRVYADRASFAKVSAWHRADGFADPRLARQIALLRNSFAKGQQDDATIEQVTRLQKEVESTFNTFR